MNPVKQTRQTTVFAIVAGFALGFLNVLISLHTATEIGNHAEFVLLSGIAFALLCRAGTLPMLATLAGSWFAASDKDVIDGLHLAAIAGTSWLSYLVLSKKDFDPLLRRGKDFALVLLIPVLSCIPITLFFLLMTTGILPPDQDWVPLPLLEVVFGQLLGSLLVSIPILMVSYKRLKRAFTNVEFWLLSLVTLSVFCLPITFGANNDEHPIMYIFAPLIIWSSIRLKRFAHSIILIELSTGILVMPARFLSSPLVINNFEVPMAIVMFVGIATSLFMSTRQGERRYQQNLLQQRNEIYRWLAGMRQQFGASGTGADVLYQLCKSAKSISAAIHAGIAKETNHGYEWLYDFMLTQHDKTPMSLREDQYIDRRNCSSYPIPATNYTVICIPLKEKHDGDLLLLITLHNPLLINGELLSFFNDQRQLLQSELEKRLIDAERQRLGMALRDAEAMWQYALESSGEGIWDWHIQANVEYYSNRCQLLMGFAEAVTHDAHYLWRNRIHPDDVEKWETALQQYLNGETDHYQSEFRILQQNGKSKWVFSRGKVISWDENAKPVRMIGSVLDVSELRQADEERLLAAQVFEASHEGILIIDEDKRILSANSAFLQMIGYRADQVIHKPALFFSAITITNEQDLFWDQLASQQFWQGEWIAQKENGSHLPLWLSVSCVMAQENTHASRYILLASDMTQRKADSDRIQYLAHHDLLTGLPNRALMMDRLEQLLLNCERQKTNFACLFIDLDHFKHINDSLGHPVGDLLLQDVAQRLTSHVRKGDTISRLGGDEFVLLLPNVSSKDIDRVCEHLRKTLSDPFTINHHVLHITPSIGISVYPDDGKTAESLIKHADVAMYHAKQQGRNNIQQFRENLLDASRERLVIESGLRAALNHDRLSLRYQPQFNTASGELEGMEALLRWKDPELGQVSPGQFIPIAEESHLILDLGNFVLNESCRQLAEWIAAGHTPPTLAINVSLRQLMQDGFAEQVLDTLAYYHLPPKLLEIELTETMLMHDPQHAQHVLEVLTSAGVGVAIDDFGTGYSSLSYLKRLSVTRIKIDQSFVKDLEHGGGDEAIVRAILGLAQNLKMAVTAEGVETEAQLSFLKSAGCDSCQGYYYAPPLVPDGFEALLQGNHPTQTSYFSAPETIQ
ncbi:EAL domain-containing protein [Leeia sp. TBRC 13508]|uniref:EAL domain-containing protein n=1 Tax=Leeia speluncae TaxID=2884804 RepID=A0ABS8D5A0_9NEIS|nr:EAL domain-containing protein [Leeia speluncae]MCB6183400.1 EAL domain-containing protein [Leeia speluncae]